jgi:hypothetical protein
MAVQRVVKGLAQEAWDEADSAAATWNLDRGPPNEVKERYVGWQHALSVHQLLKSDGNVTRCG